MPGCYDCTQEPFDFLRYYFLLRSSSCTCMFLQKAAQFGLPSIWIYIWIQRQCTIEIFWAGPRVMHAAMMLLEAKRWLETELPYWNRTGGRNHIWLISHDEGSCWAPAEIRSSIILSHWGRKVVDFGQRPASYVESCKIMRRARLKICLVQTVQTTLD